MAATREPAGCGASDDRAHVLPEALRRLRARDAAVRIELREDTAGRVGISRRSARLVIAAHRSFQAATIRRRSAPMHRGGVLRPNCRSRWRITLASCTVAFDHARPAHWLASRGRASAGRGVLQGRVPYAQLATVLGWWAPVRRADCPALAASRHNTPRRVLPSSITCCSGRSWPCGRSGWSPACVARVRRVRARGGRGGIVRRRSRASRDHRKHFRRRHRTRIRHDPSSAARDRRLEAAMRPTTPGHG